jgi:hypothetical protein
VSLPPFSGVLTHCPMCSTKEKHRVAYDKGGVDGPARMHRHCNVCSYGWWEQPANADPDPAEDAAPAIDVLKLISTFVTQEDVRKLIKRIGEIK